MGSLLPGTGLPAHAAVVTVTGPAAVRSTAHETDPHPAGTDTAGVETSPAGADNWETTGGGVMVACVTRTATSSSDWPPGNPLVATRRHVYAPGASPLITALMVPPDTHAPLANTVLAAPAGPKYTTYCGSVAWMSKADHVMVAGSFSARLSAPGWLRAGQTWVTVTSHSAWLDPPTGSVA